MRLPWGDPEPTYEEMLEVMRRIVEIQRVWTSGGGTLTKVDGKMLLRQLRREQEVKR
jgi:hypothetical protein